MRPWASRVIGVSLALCSAGALGGTGRHASRPADAGAFAGLPPDSTRLIAVQVKSDYELYDPNVSPGGMSVAFVRNGGDLCIYNVTTNRTRVVAHNTNSHDPAWSPDGIRLAFQGDDSVSTYGKFWIWLVNRDGSRLHRVGGSGPDGKHPVWTRDGRQLVWTQGRRLWEADTAGAGAISPPRHLTSFTWSSRAGGLQMALASCTSPGARWVRSSSCDQLARTVLTTSCATPRACSRYPVRS